MANPKKPATLLELSNDRVRILEAENGRLRKRNNELETRNCSAGDVGSIIHKAILESAKQLSTDQRTQALLDRVGILELELSTKNSIMEEERGRNTETQRIQMEQNVILTTQLNELQKKEEELKQSRKELNEMREKLQLLQQQERHYREDANREAQTCTTLREELLKTRSEHVDKLQSLHKKHRDEHSIKDSNIEQLKDQIKQKEIQIQELNSIVTRADTLSRETSTNNTITSALDGINTTLNTILDSSKGIATNTQTITEFIPTISTKVDLTQLSNVIATTEEERKTAIENDERLSSTLMAISRLAEEYGAVSGEVADPIGTLITALKRTLELKEERLQQEVRRSEEQRKKHEQEIRSYQLTQDKLVRTMEGLLEQITEIGQSKGLNQEQLDKITSKYQPE